MTALSNLSLLHVAVVTQAKRAVAGGVEASTVDREMVSAYSDTEDVLQPGERKIQVRCVADEEDRASDANTVELTASFEVTVVRSLHLTQNATDERLYREEEMLYGMTRLLDLALWEAVAEVDSVTEGPEVTSDPEREGNIITYTVSLSISYT